MPGNRTKSEGFFCSSALPQHLAQLSESIHCFHKGRVKQKPILGKKYILVPVQEQTINDRNGTARAEFPTDQQSAPLEQPHSGGEKVRWDGLTVKYSPEIISTLWFGGGDGWARVETKPRPFSATACNRLFFPPQMLPVTTRGIIAFLSVFSNFFWLFCIYLPFFFFFSSK